MTRQRYFIPLALLLSIVPLSLTGARAVTAAEQTRDGREKLPLTTRERDHMLAGMRTYLQSIQGIIEGVATNRMDRVSRSAAKSGTKLADTVNPGVAFIVPPAFTTMSLDTHAKFEDLAVKAKGGASKIEIMNGLAALLANCTNCHAAYRVEPRR